MTAKSVEFNSENHKVEVSNLPYNRIKYHDAKQVFENFYKLKPHKIKLAGNKVYLTFKNEDERKEAIEKINGQNWKDSPLIARPASPIKVKVDSTSKYVPRIYTDEDVLAKVCPLWNTDYENQLKFKTNLMMKVLNFNKKLKSLCKDKKITQNFIRCEFLGILPSPVTTGYRNKCEFNVDQFGTIGFVIARHKDVSNLVAKPPPKCPLFNKKTFEILNAFQKFINNEEKETRLSGYNSLDLSGNLRQLTIRTNELSQSLIIIDMDPQKLTEEEIEEETNNMLNLLKPIDGIVSVYLNISDRNHLLTADQTMKLIYGQHYLYEYLKITDDDSPPLKFRIGPLSFFQVNTKGAELLYKTIIELAQLDSNSLVLDLGCGTGTISLSLARQVHQVIGVEINKSSIEDAKINAKENNITNVMFYCGSAEDLIDETIKILKCIQKDQKTKGDIVIIVDPPRTGFLNSVIKTIRAADIYKVVYVACDPEANTNLVSLCRPTSASYQRDPFIPTRAKAIDLFPQTKFCELVLVYERQSAPQPTSSSPKQSSNSNIEEK